MALDQDIDNITRIPLFAIFEANAVRMVAFSSETRLLRTGDTLFRRGEVSDCGYILSAGSISLMLHDDGRPAEHVLHPWAVLGETALIAQTIYPATAIAREPSTVLKLGRAVFHQILEQHPLTAARLRDFVRDRLIDFTRNAAASTEKAG